MSIDAATINGEFYRVARWVHGRPCDCSESLPKDWRCSARVARCAPGKAAILASPPTREEPKP